MSYKTPPAPGSSANSRDGDYNELPDDYLDNYVQKISAVSAADVSEWWKYLLADRMTIVVVGDKSKITEQLKPYEIL